MLTFDDINDRTPVEVDGLNYLVIVAINRPERRELIIYWEDFGSVTGLAFYAQPDVYEVTLPTDERVAYVGNDVAEAIRWLSLEDQV